jgi:chromosome segregation ATPase
LKDLVSLRKEAARLEDEIARLEVAAREFDRSLAEFDHQARRYNDSLERVGGRSREIERALKSVRDNRNLAGRERADLRAEIEKLANRVSALKARIAAIEG